MGIRYRTIAPEIQTIQPKKSANKKTNNAIDQRIRFSFTFKTRRFIIAYTKNVTKSTVSKTDMYLKTPPSSHGNGRKRELTTPCGLK